MFNAGRNSRSSVPVCAGRGQYSRAADSLGIVEGAGAPLASACDGCSAATPSAATRQISREDLEALLELPSAAWEAVRVARPSEPSPPREHARLSTVRAAL